MYSNTLFRVHVQQYTVYTKCTAINCLEKMSRNTLFILNVHNTQFTVNVQQKTAYSKCTAIHCLE